MTWLHGFPFLTHQVEPMAGAAAGAGTEKAGRCSAFWSPLFQDDPKLKPSVFRCKRFYSCPLTVTLLRGNPQRLSFWCNLGISASLTLRVVLCVVLWQNPYWKRPSDSKMGFCAADVPMALLSTANLRDVLMWMDRLWLSLSHRRTDAWHADGPPGFNPSIVNEEIVGWKAMVA